MKKNILRISIIACICILGLFMKENTRTAVAAQSGFQTVLMFPNSTKIFKIPEAQGKIKWRLGLNNKNMKFTKSGQSGKVTVKKNGRGSIYATYKVKGITYVNAYNIYTLGKKFDKEKLNFISKKTVNKYKKAYKKKSTKGLSKSEKKVYKGLKKALDTTKGYKTKAEKELAIHDWIVNNTVYTYVEVVKNTGRLPNNYSYVGVFANGKAVCGGYAQAFKLCMDILGIPCEYIIGYPAANYSVLHLWNRVKLDDGKWYQVDCTYDDPTSDRTGKSGDSNLVRYNYFNCTDAQMKDHDYVNTRKCTGTKYSAKNMKKSMFVDTEKEWYDTLKKAAAQGKTTVRIFRKKDFMVPGAILLPMYTGKNISKTECLSPLYRVRTVISPGKKEYVDTTYKITYADNKSADKITYIDSAAQFEQLLQSSVAAGRTKISNVVFPTKSKFAYENYYSNKAVLYDLTGKHISLGGFGTIVELPSYMNKAGNTYQYLGDIKINYDELNVVVNVPKTIDEFVAVLEATITNRQKSVVIYGKGFEYDALDSAILEWQGKHQDHLIYRKISFTDPVGQFEFVHPEKGVIANPLWYEFSFVY